MAKDVRICLLGPLIVLREGVEVPIGGRRQRRLLAALATFQTVAPADRLIAATWSDEELPVDPRASLRTAFTRLRTALGADLVETHFEGWKLNDGITLDVREFEAGVAAAGSPIGGIEFRIAAIDEALSLWRGDAYQEFRDEEWALSVAVRLDELRVAALEQRYDLMLEAGLHSEAVPGLVEASRAHPLRDRFVGQLMRALYRSGRRTEAGRVFAEHRGRLLDEIGLVPGPDLVDLDRMIAADDPALLSTFVFGDQLRGYRLGEVVGEGVHSVVYKGTQPYLGRDVAVKLIQPSLADHPDFIRRFESEALLVSRLEHPHVVPLYDYWREPGRACLVFRYLRGGALDRLLKSQDPDRLSIPLFSRLVEQIGGALETAHRSGILHQDIKPSNIFLDETDNFYLGDFSVARLAKAALPAQTSRTQGEMDIQGDLQDLRLTLHAVASRLDEDLPTRAARTLSDIAVPPNQIWSTVAEFVEDLTASLNHGTDKGATRSTIMSADVPPNPYVGLRAFGESDTEAFYGREELVELLVGCLSPQSRSERLLAVVGPSGIGKSSVVKAGLIPRIRSGAIRGSQAWYVAEMSPGRDVYEELAVALLKVAERVPDNMMSQIRSDNRGIARVIKAVLPADAVLVLVIDQFEELFTNNAGPSVANDFLDALAVVVEDEQCPVRLVLTVRADFWHHPLQHGVFGSLLQTSAVNVPALRPDQIEQAIVGPARSSDVEYGPGLVAEIVAYIADEAGALPLLQYALVELWPHQISRLLTRDAYTKVGGVSGALTTQAENLASECSDVEFELLRRIFGQLVAIGQDGAITKRRVKMSQIGQGTNHTAVVDKLGESRLVTFDRDPITREPTMEVAHEALLTMWPRLRRWIEEDREEIRVSNHLSSQTAVWVESNRDESELYRGGRLETAETWATENNDRLSPLEREFVAKSVHRRDEEQVRRAAQLESERRSNRRLRLVTTAVAVAAALAILSAVVAFNQRQSAQETAEVAETARLVAQSSSFADSNPRLAALLAIAAHQRVQSPATLGALQEALVGAAPLRGLYGHGQSYIDVEVLPSGKFVGVRSDGIDLFTPDSPWPIDRLQLEIGRITTFLDSVSDRHRVAAAADADRVVVVDRVGVVRVFDVTDELVEIRQHVVDSVPASVAIDRTGDRYLIADASGLVRGFTFSGSLLFERDFELAANLSEQADLILDEVTKLRNIFSAVPVRITAIPLDGDLVLQVGAAHSRLSWAGELLAGPTLPTVDFGGSPLPMVSLDARLTSGSRLRLVGPSSSTELDWNSPWPVTTDAQSYAAFFGAGTPYILGVGDSDNSTDITIGTSDGQVAVLNPASGEIDTRIYSRPSQTNVVAIGHSRAALATQDGIYLISLLGEGPISNGLSRRPDQPTASISPDGTTVYLGPGGAPGSVSVSNSDGSPAVGFTLRPSGTPIAGGFIPAVRPEMPVWYALEDGSEESDVHAVTVDGVRFDRTIVDPIGGVASDITDELVAVANVVPLVIDPETGDLLMELPGPAQTTDVTFHPFRNWLLAASATGRAVLYDTITWQPVEDIDLSGERISVANWSRDGALLATADFGGSIVVRDGFNFKPIRSIDSPTFGAETWNDSALIFSDDLTLLLTNLDGEGQLWDVSTGERIGRSFPNHPLGNSGVNWGTHPQLVTTTDNSALIWNLDTGSWADHACRLAGSEMTDHEWEQWGPNDEPYRTLCS